MKTRLIWKFGGMAIIALFIPALFAANQHPFLSQSYLVHDALKSLVYTIIYWEVNLFIFNQLKKRYSSIEDNVKRLVIEFVLITAFSVSFGIFGCPIINEVIFRETLVPQDQFLYLKISVGVTYFILTIYEGVEYFNRWKQTALDAERLKREQLISQFEVLKQQISPHFLFNTLNTLMTLIPEDQDKALKYTEHLSKVYRYVLMNKDLDTVDLGSEIRFVESFYYLNKIRFGDKLHLNMEIPETKHELQIAPLSLQILVENAIKHNEISKTRPLEIQVLVKGNKEIIVRNTLQKKAHTSGTKIGLENIINRYKLLGNYAVGVFSDESSFSVTLPVIARTH